MAWPYRQKRNSAISASGSRAARLPSPCLSATTSACASRVATSRCASAFFIRALPLLSPRRPRSHSFLTLPLTSATTPSHQPWDGVTHQCVLFRGDNVGRTRTCVVTYVYDVWHVDAGSRARYMLILSPRRSPVLRSRTASDPGPQRCRHSPSRLPGRPRRLREERFFHAGNCRTGPRASAHRSTARTCALRAGLVRTHRRTSRLN